MFKDARIGDRVWSPLGGWGSVDEVSESCLKVHFDCTYVLNFFKDGYASGYSVCPSLFWAEVKIDPPPRPKRKVKKSNTVYLVPGKCTVSTFFSKEIAVEVARNYDAVSPIVPFTYEWEEEE